MSYQNNTTLVLPKVVTCKEKGINLPVINCEHWEAKDNCNPVCKLNLVDSPDYKKCKDCKERKPIKSETMENYKRKEFVNINENVKQTLEAQSKKLQEIQEKFAKQKKEQEEKILNEKSFLDKAVSYLKAESSQATQGKISNSNFEKRKEICMSCPFKVNDVLLKNGTTAHDSVGWCKGGCGCSVGSERAALSTKLYMPTLSCPKGKFGVEKGAGFEISDAVDSAKGILTSAISIFKKPQTDK
jgi:thiol-disulfide isomerase/thioredoxin